MENGAADLWDVLCDDSTPLFTVTSGGSGCINDDSPSSISPEAAAATVSGVGGGGGRPSGSGSGSSR